MNILRSSLTLLLLSLCPLVARESYVAVEAHTGKVLLELNADIKRPVASLTNIATAMVVLDWAELSGTSMGVSATVPEAAANITWTNPMGLAPGDQITLREAMYSMMLGSDHVSTLTLADHVGHSIMARGSRSRTPVAAFVSEMNHLARALRMTRTRFTNPFGVDSLREKGTSTARDIAALSIYAMRSTGFQYYVKQKSRTIASTRRGERRAFKVKNTHNLIDQMGINGIKAGATALAGPCLATSAQKPNIVLKLDDGRTLLTPRRLIVICLGSSGHDTRTTELVEQAWPLYEQWMSQGRPTSYARREIISVPKI